MKLRTYQDVKRKETTEKPEPTSSHQYPSNNSYQRNMSTGKTVSPDHICLFIMSAKAEASNPILLQGFGTFMFFGLFLASVREWRCVVKMTMSLWKSDSEKRNSAFSAKARRPLIHTIKQWAKERKKRHHSAQRFPASVNSNLGCCWWLAVCQTLTEFQNGNNQAVMSVSPWGTDIFANLLSMHLAIGCSMEHSWILEKTTETEF